VSSLACAPMPPHLTSADAVAIYQLSASRNNTKLIAEKFGVSRRAVYDIWNRVSWVPETLPYWSEQHRLAYTAGAPPDKTRRAITIDEAVAIYKARPHPAHMRSAARPLAATVRTSVFMFIHNITVFHILRAFLTSFIFYVSSRLSSSTCSSASDPRPSPTSGTTSPGPPPQHPTAPPPPLQPLRLRQPRPSARRSCRCTPPSTTSPCTP